MERPELTFDPAIGYWIDRAGARWVRNLFDENNPVFVNIDKSVWVLDQGQVEYACRINWNEIALPSRVKEVFQHGIAEKLLRQSASSLNNYRLMLERIGNSYAQKAIEVDFLSDLEQIAYLWDKWFRPSDRICFRSLYEILVHDGLAEADYQIHQHLQWWSARTDVQSLRPVLEWNPETGALTTAELEVLRQELYRPFDYRKLPPCYHFAKIVTWAFMATLRRTAQILKVSSDGLKRVTSPDGHEEAFLAIPGSKAQTNSGTSWERIPVPLANEIDAYRARSDVAHLAAVDPHLLFLVTKKGIRGVTIAATIRAIITSWVKKRNLISPRTKKLMKISMNRLRHTGATQLAMQGCPRSVIQTALQHDSPISAQAYIDSVGADTLPILEQVDRRLGGKFSQIKDAYFIGKIVSENQTDAPRVIVPDRVAPAVVGACGNADRCPFHPLFSCYSCIHFLAFKEGNHSKALDHVEEKAASWECRGTGGDSHQSSKGF